LLPIEIVSVGDDLKMTRQAVIYKRPIALLTLMLSPLRSPKKEAPRL
jgi:hypothetical protein